MSDLTPETLAEIVKDDVRFWLSNPFMTPELLAGKVCAWVDRALAAEKAAREEADRYAALQTETLRTSEALVKRHAAGEAEQRLRAVKAEQERDEARRLNEKWEVASREWEGTFHSLTRALTEKRAAEAQVAALEATLAHREQMENLNAREVTRLRDGITQYVADPLAVAGADRDAESKALRAVASQLRALLARVDAPKPDDEKGADRG